MKNISLIPGMRLLRTLVSPATGLRTGLALLVSFAAASVAQASVLWDGAASKGIGVFEKFNLVGSSTLTVVSDGTYGSVFRFYKPSGSERSEAHGTTGYNITEGTTIYIGWVSKVNSTVTNNAIFQWKTYPTTGPNSFQNWPIVLKIISGKLTILQRQPNNVVNTILSKSTTANVWHKHVLAIKISRGTTGGYLQYWLNGSRQTFSNGSQTWNCKTWDGDYCDPKWGIYGATGTTINSYVGKLKIGTTYADVAP
jgi:hypothetical protein